METKLTPAEEAVGLFLANGFTKKETANHLNKSERTVGRQADDLYKKTGSRNLADITRFMVIRYKGVDGLIHAIHDVTLAFITGFLFWALFEGTDQSLYEALKTSLHTIF